MRQKLVNIVFVLAAAGYAAMAVGCGPTQYDLAVADARELAIDDPYWSRISPLPEKDGFYYMHDKENGRLCYIVINKYWDAMSLECQYNADEPQQGLQIAEPEIVPDLTAGFYWKDILRRGLERQKKYKCEKPPRGLCQIG